MKLKIRNMTNNALIIEWQIIRDVNNVCEKRCSNCYACDFVSCYDNLKYEEIITNELVNRGLFDYAVTKYCEKKTMQNRHKIYSSKQSNQFYK